MMKYVILRGFELRQARQDKRGLYGDYLPGLGYTEVYGYQKALVAGTSDKSNWSWYSPDKLPHNDWYCLTEVLEPDEFNEWGEVCL